MSSQFTRAMWSASRVTHNASRGFGDLGAASSGRLGKRLVRRQVTKRLVGPWLNRLFR